MNWLALTMLVAAPAMAESPYDGFMRGVPACLENGAHHCIGESAAACFAGAPDGETTTGMMFCLLAERDAWDVLLNEEYRLARAEAQAIDAVDRVSSPHYAVRAERLRDAQRAWIAFRDAECALRYDWYGAGTLRQIAGATCHMTQTAERSFALRAMRSGFGGE